MDRHSKLSSWPYIPFNGALKWTLYDDMFFRGVYRAIFVAFASAGHLGVPLWQVRCSLSFRGMPSNGHAES